MRRLLKFGIFCGIIFVNLVSHPTSAPPAPAPPAPHLNKSVKYRYSQRSVELFRFNWLFILEGRPSSTRTCSLRASEHITIADIARKSRMGKSLLKQCMLQNLFCMISYQFGTAVTPYLYQRTHCC